MNSGFREVEIGSPPPKDDYYQVNTFAGGLDMRDAPEDQAQGSSPEMLDMEISLDDRLVRAPGITLDEALGHTPTQVVLHPGFSFESELLMFAGNSMGVKSRGATTWYNLGLRGAHWAFTNFAGVLLLTDGAEGLFYRKPGETALTLIPESNVGQAVTVFANRVILGGAVMDNGNLDLMGVAWSGASNDYMDWTGEGANRQVLIGSMKRADRIQAFGSLGFNQLAIICRRSIWLGTETGDVDQPVRFEPRLEDTGSTHRDTIITTEFGVCFLAEDGVRLFNGVEAPVISDQINAELLPVNEAGAYSATLDPASKRYYLFTPTATYVLDILRRRWYKWSTTLSGGAFFPVQGALGPTWGAAVGTWGAQTLAWWQLLPQESGGKMYFTKAQNLGYQDATATAAFGVALVPQWFDRRQVGVNQESLLTHIGAYLTYEASAAATVEIWLPKTGSGDYEAVTSRVIPLAAKTGRIMIPFIHTGRGVGFGIKFLAGFPRLRRASVRYQVVTEEIFEGTFGRTYPGPPIGTGWFITTPGGGGGGSIAGVFNIVYASPGAKLTITVVGGGGGGGVGIAGDGGGGGGINRQTIDAVLGPIVTNQGLGGSVGAPGGTTSFGGVSASGGNPPAGGFGGSSGSPTPHGGGGGGGAAFGGSVGPPPLPAWSVQAGGGGGGAGTAGTAAIITAQHAQGGQGGAGGIDSFGAGGGGGSLSSGAGTNVDGADGGHAPGSGGHSGQPGQNGAIAISVSYGSVTATVS